MAAKKSRRREVDDFGAVRRFREERGLPQKKPSPSAPAITATYVGFIERGDSVSTLTVILQVAAGLEVRVAELLRDF